MAADATSSVGSRPYYQRQPGDVAVHLDVVDAEPLRPEQLGSRQYFLRSLSDRFADLLRRSDLQKLRAFFAKRGLLADTTIEYFTDSCLCVLCPCDAAALQQLRKDYESGRVETVFTECFVTPVAMKKLKVKNLLLQVKMWQEELQRAETEWSSGEMPVPYDMASNDKSRRMLVQLRQFQQQFLQQPQSGAVQRLRDAESRSESSLTSLLNFLKLLRGNSLEPIRTVGEVSRLHASERDVLRSPDARLLDAYLADLREAARCVRVVESGVRQPLAQIRVGGESPEQRRCRRDLFGQCAAAAGLLADDCPLADCHEPLVARISPSDRHVAGGFVSLLPRAVRAVVDLDEAIDAYFNAGTVVLKASELTVD